MTPETIALVFQILNLVIQEAPDMLKLVVEFKAALTNNAATQQTLKQITDGTIQVSAEALAVLKPLLQVG